MNSDIIITLVLLSIFFIIFIWLVLLKTKKAEIASSRIFFFVFCGLVGGLIVIGVVTFGIEITFLIISFAFLLSLLSLDR